MLLPLSAALTSARWRGLFCRHLHNAYTTITREQLDPVNLAFSNGERLYRQQFSATLTLRLGHGFLHADLARHRDRRQHRNGHEGQKNSQS